MIGERLKGWFASSSRFVAASAKLAKKQAELATLNNVTLPRLYHAIGKRIIDSPNLPPDLVPYREKIRELEAAIAAKPEEPKSEPASGFAAKAKQLAQQAASKTAKATADAGASIKIQSAYVALGRQAVEKYGPATLPRDLRDQYEVVLQSKTDLINNATGSTAATKKGLFSTGGLRLLGISGCILLALLGIRSVTGWATRPSELRKMPTFESPSAINEQHDGAPDSSKPPKRNREPIEIDALVSAVLGSTSKHYTPFGYKGVTLGQTFDEINSKRPLGALDYDPLGGFNVDGPCVYRDLAGTPDWFYFDASKRLVCYCFAYSGGAGEYLGEIEKLFGQPNKPIDVWVTGNSFGSTKSTNRFYAFPRTFVSVEFRRVADLGGTREFTNIHVFDRAYLERLLRAVATARLKACLWIKAASVCLEVGDVSPESCPELQGCRIEPLEKLASTGAALFDVKNEQNSEVPFLGYVAISEIGDHNHEPMVYFDFRRFNASEFDFPLLRRAGAEADNTSTNAFYHLPCLRDLKGELMALMMSEQFPMPNGIYRIATDGRSGIRTFKWEYKDTEGHRWAIQCGTNDVVEVVYRASRRL